MQNQQPEKVLLSGVAGFIGSHTAQQLLSQGIEVVGIDSVNDAYDPAIKHHRLAELEGREGLRIVRGDIEDRDLLKTLFEENEFKAVVHLAAQAGVRYSMENPSVYLQTNAQGTLNLLELMRDREVNKMVLASTSSLYAGHPMPFREDMPVNCPISPYAASKKAAELMAHSFRHLYDLDISVVRYFTVFGPAGRPDMCIFRFMRWIDEGTPIELFGDGTQSRDFTYVDDIARGTVLAMKPVGYEIVNLGGGMQPVSLLQVIGMLEELLGKKAELLHRDPFAADVWETRAEISKAEELLGWKPQTSLEEGLKKTVAWYEANRDWVGKVSL